MLPPLAVGASEVADDAPRSTARPEGSGASVASFAAVQSKRPAGAGSHAVAALVADPGEADVPSRRRTRAPCTHPHRRNLSVSFGGTRRNDVARLAYPL